MKQLCRKQLQTATEDSNGMPNFRRTSNELPAEELPNSQRMYGFDDMRATLDDTLDSPGIISTALSMLPLGMKFALYAHWMQLLRVGVALGFSIGIVVSTSEHPVTTRWQGNFKSFSINESTLHSGHFVLDWDTFCTGSRHVVLEQFGNIAIRHCAGCEFSVNSPWIVWVSSSEYSRMVFGSLYQIKQRTELQIEK